MTTIDPKPPNTPTAPMPNQPEAPPPPPPQPDPKIIPTIIEPEPGRAIKATIPDEPSDEGN